MKLTCAAAIAFTLLIPIGSVHAINPPSIADDLSPRFAIDDAGVAWVTWWCDLATDQVHLRNFSFETMTYGPDRLISGTAENARNPEIAYDGTSMALVYEVHGTSGTSIAVGIIADEPDPVPTVTLRTTTYTGQLGLQVRAESAHLWVTWIDDAAYVGWSEYSYETQQWSAPTYACYSGSSVASVREAIQATVMGE
jgi:hypothetical protein